MLKPDEQLHAPHLIDIEIAQTLRGLAQLKESAAARGRQALEEHRPLLARSHDHGARIDFIE